MTALLRLLQWEFPLQTSRGNHVEHFVIDYCFVKYSVDFVLRFSM